MERQQKEQAYGHMNDVKIHNQWRRIMRMAKTEDLKQDIEILSQSYDRSVDRKDALIQVCTCYMSQHHRPVRACWHPGATGYCETALVHHHQVAVFDKSSDKLQTKV